MQTRKIIAGAVIASLLVFSCGENKNNSNSNNGGLDLEAITNRKTADPNASGDNKCLMDYQTKYDQLLTEEMALTATGFPKEKLKVKYSNVLKNPGDHSISYRFDMGRVQENPALNIPKMALPDNIRLGSIKPMSLKSFNNSYRSLTEEEQQSFDEAKKEVLSGNNDEAADAISKGGIDKKTVEKGVDHVGGLFNQINKAYTVVDGLGDAARWNTLTKELMVLQNGVKFELTVDIDSDMEKNKSVAIDLAKQILEKCK